MRVNWTDWAVLTVLLGAGCAALYAGLSRALRYAVAERQRETERQIKALALTVKALQGLVAELGRLQTDHAQQGAVMAEAAESAAGETKEPMKPETLATLAAAATTFLGKKARIRSVRTTATEESATAWAQQGRVIVQTSHNLRPNG